MRQLGQLDGFQLGLQFFHVGMSHLGTEQEYESHYARREKDS